MNAAIARAGRLCASLKLFASKLAILTSASYISSIAANDGLTLATSGTNVGLLFGTAWLLLSLYVAADALVVVLSQELETTAGATTRFFVRTISISLVLGALNLIAGLGFGFSMLFQETFG